MSRNGSGVYSAPSSSWNPAVAGTIIDQTDWAALLADLVAAITASIANDGQTTCSAQIPFAAGLKVSDGTVTAPSIGFTADLNNGAYRIGTDNWGLTAGGVKVIDMSASTVTIPVALSVPAGFSSGSFTQNPAADNTYYTAIAAATITTNANGRYIIFASSGFGVAGGSFDLNHANAINTLTTVAAGVDVTVQIDGSGNFQVKQTTGGADRVFVGWLFIPGPN